VVATAAHELRAPITVLLGQAQLQQRRLATREHVDPGDQRAADQMVAQSIRLSLLINALLDATYLDHGQLQVSLTTLDLGALVQRVIQTIQPTLHTHTLRLISSTGPIAVKGDSLRLEQVLQNLLQNAVTYSPAGSEIVVVVAPHEQGVRISVCDQGCGVAASVQPHLFQRYYRAEPGDGQFTSGLGLGLYICKAIMDLHGGSIMVESMVGAGSTFTLLLPSIPLVPTGSTQAQ
jgi:signal transduction histidine kinase